MISVTVDLAVCPHDADMQRLIALLLGPLVMAGLVYGFGFLAVPVCFALALSTLVFSNGPGNEESVRRVGPQGVGELSTFMGGL